MYDVVLFLHILGVVTLVTALAFSLCGLFAAQRASDDSGIRSALNFVPVAEKLIPPAMITILAAGLYLVGNGHWGWGTGWVDVALAIFAVMMVLGPGVEGKRIGAMHEKVAEAPDGPIPPELDAMRADPVLTHVATFGSTQIVVFLYLMTNKPSLGGALLTAAIGAAVSMPLARLALRLSVHAAQGAQPFRPAVVPEADPAEAIGLGSARDA